MDRSGVSPLVPLLGPPPEPLTPERADAARNRARLLDAARSILDQHGPEALTMDRLAAESGVGKGTIFRRFGSRAGLFEALLDESERAFQLRFLSGPPPLGPGAPAVERLVAFGRERLATYSVVAEVMRAAERPVTERAAIPVRRVVEVHIALLVREAGYPADVPVLAFNLMAVLDAIVQLPGDEIARMLPRLSDGWEQLVRRVLRD